MGSRTHQRQIIYEAVHIGILRGILLFTCGVLYGSSIVSLYFYYFYYHIFSP